MGGKDDDWRLKAFITRFPDLYDMVDGKKVIKAGLGLQDLKNRTIIIEYKQKKDSQFFSINKIQSKEEFLEEIQKNELANDSKPLAESEMPI